MEANHGCADLNTMRNIT